MIIFFKYFPYYTFDAWYTTIMPKLCRGALWFTERLIWVRLRRPSIWERNWHWKAWHASVSNSTPTVGKIFFLWWWSALSSSRKDNCKAWLWTSFSMLKTFQTRLIKRQWITIATSWQAKWLCLQWALSWSHSLQPICYQFAKMWPNERKGITLASSML